jgi:hypothetical protein
MKRALLPEIGVFVLVVSAWRVGHAPGQLAGVLIIVEPSAKDLRAECLKGCAWTTTSANGDPGKSVCRIEFDESGIGNAKEIGLQPQPDAPSHLGRDSRHGPSVSSSNLKGLVSSPVSWPMSSQRGRTRPRRSWPG